MEKDYYVYIMASGVNGTLYVGVTSNLPKRVWEHKESVVAGFTKRYGVKILVYYEMTNSAEAAIHREKRLKKYTRNQKIKLITTTNPMWNDLYEEVCK